VNAIRNKLVPYLRVGISKDDVFRNLGIMASILIPLMIYIAGRYTGNKMYVELNKAMMVFSLSFFIKSIRSNTFKTNNNGND
jgi:hypothetical protein